MYEFKKTDSAELQKCISVCIAFTMVAIPIVYLLELFCLIQTPDRVLVSEATLVLCAFVTFIFSLYFVLQKENRKIKKIDIIMIAMLVSVVLSTIFARDKALAFGGSDVTCENAFVFFAYIILGYSATLVSEKKNRRVLYCASVIVGLMQVCMALMQTVFIIPLFQNYTGDGIEANRSRAFGTVRNANPFGSLMILLTALECGLFYDSKTKREKIAHGFLAGVYFFALLLSGTRGAYVGFLVGAIVITIIVFSIKNNSATRKKVAKKIASISLGIFIVFGAFLLWEHSNGNSVVDRTMEETSSGVMGGHRLFYWQKALTEEFISSPIVGIGIGNVHIVYAKYSKEYGLDYESVTDTHNRYVNIITTQGIIGILVYLSMLLYLIGTGIKKIKSNNGHAEGIGLLFAIIGYLIADIFCIGMYSSVFYFYIALGMLASRKED